MAQDQPTKLDIWGATDRGRARPANEDNIYPNLASHAGSISPNTAKGYLLLVADGVGGAQAGATASEVGVKVAVDNYFEGPSLRQAQDTAPNPGENLRAAIETANSTVYQVIQGSPSVREAGSTMVAAAALGNQLYVANVGDSRAYLVRDDQATQLTRDHTLTQHKIDAGILTPEQAADDLDSHVITRSLGAGASVKVDVFPPLALQAGDVVLLCSDGLSDVVSPAEIARVAASRPPQKATQELIKLANKRGGPDNISVVIGRVPGGPALGGRGLGRWRALLLGGAGIIFALLCLVAAVGFFATRDGGQPTKTLIPTLTSSPAAPTTTVTAAPAALTATATHTPAVTPTPREQPIATATSTPTRSAMSTAIPTNTLTATATRRPRPTRAPDTSTPSPLPSVTTPSPQPGPTNPPQSATDTPKLPPTQPPQTPTNPPPPPP